MKRVLCGVLLVTTFFLGGCTSSRELADTAYARGDWDEATRQYEDALSSAETARDIDFIRQRLEECRSNAYRMHWDRSIASEMAGDLPTAFSEAEAALAYMATPEAGRRVGELRPQVAAMLLARAKDEMLTDQWDAAVADLTEAHRLAPSFETSALLEKAQEGAARQNQYEAGRSGYEARRALTAHDWPRAAELYRQALAYGETPEFTNSLAFCETMQNAEDARARGDVRNARAAYERALGYDIEAAHVRECLYSLPPQR